MEGGGRWKLRDGRWEMEKLTEMDHGRLSALSGDIAVTDHQGVGAPPVA